MRFMEERRTSNFYYEKMQKRIAAILFSSVAIVSLSVFWANAQGVTLPQNTGLSSKPIADVIANFTSWILGIFGFLAVISFLVSGIMYFFAAGDETAQEKAKKQMQWSIMGVVIGLMGLVIIYAIDALLGGATSF
jgi:hypothetical protein